MDEFPDPDDEYEMMYADQMEMLREFEDGESQIQRKASPIHQKSLNVPNKELLSSQPDKLVTDNVFDDDLFGGSISDIEDDNVDGNRLVIDEPTRRTSNNLGASQIYEKENVPQSIESLIRNAKRRLIPEETQLFSEGLRNSYRRRPLLPQMDDINEPKDDCIDPDIILMDRIMMLRKRIKLDDGNGIQSFEQKGSRGLSRSYKSVIHHNLPTGDFQAITTADGLRFYLDQVSNEDFKEVVRASNDHQEDLQLLAQPFSNIKAQAEVEFTIMQSRIVSHAAEASDSLDVVVTEQSINGQNDSNDVTPNNDLWVEKYKPRHYFDLLSDEATNRTVLQWVKLWDKVVFGRERKVRTKEEKKLNKPQFDGKPKFFSRMAPEVLEEFDELGRPVQRVILLYGPPGLGKTTLAHIIARHAGYNIVEMNASDDRSADVFKKNLENATSMKAVFGNDRRPNCLIIDEIDGAPAPSINLLVALLTGKKLNAQEAKKKDTLLLKRPVICICNDLYAPALRALRQMALVIQFPPTQPTRLAQRLFSISSCQKLKADLSVLLALCEKTENDIRSCLSVLQFVRSNSSELRLRDLSGVAIGLKDYQKSLFAVWKEVFTIPRPKKQRVINPHEQITDGKGIIVEAKLTNTEKEAPVTTLGERLRNVIKVAQSCGEYDKLMLGWFENYPAIKFKQTHLEPVLKGLEWATMCDILQTEIYHHQTWILMGYLSLAFAVFHAGFSLHQSPKLMFPSKYSEFQTRHGKSLNLLTTLCNEMSPQTYLFSTKSNLVYDILPYMMGILQPSLRPVNMHLLSSQEKKNLAHVVDSMISYNMTFQQEKTFDGQYNFTLDPNMEEIAIFPNIPHGKPLPYSSKQLIAREVELEKMRRSERYFEQQNNTSKEKKDKFTLMNPNKKSAPEKKTKPGNPTSSTGSNASLPNHLQRLEVKKVQLTTASKTARDFFGREIVYTASQQQKKDEETASILKGSIGFKFKAGYSNAVRRPIKIRDFIH